METKQRIESVLNLFLQGEDVSDIGRELRMSATRVCQDLRAVVGQLVEYSLELQNGGSVTDNANGQGSETVLTGSPITQEGQ